MTRRLTAALAVLLLAVLPSATAPASAAPRAAAQVLTWTADDDITRYKSAPTQAVAGETTIIWENSAATGNTTGMPHTLTFDTSTEGYNHDVTLNILASPFDANDGRHQATVTLTPGRYRYFCSIPGHGQMVGELVVTDGGGGDTTPPEVSASVAGDQDQDGNYVGAATVTVTATDAGSGVDTVEYQIDDTSFQPYTAPVQVTAIGDHSVQFRATDQAGNTSAVGSVSFRIVEPGEEDTTAPTVTADIAGDRDGDGNYIGTATATLTANDAQSGVATIEYSLDGAAFTTYTAPVVVDDVGMHMLHYRATDVAGNTSAEQMAHFTVVAATPEDTTPPVATATVAGDQDENGAYIGRATVTVTATDAESGVTSIEYALDTGAWTAYTGPVGVQAAGAHTLRYRATDTAGNTSAEQSTTFTVVPPPAEDTTPPVATATITGDQDENGAYIGRATVTVTATDAESGVTSIEYALDTGAWTAYTGPVGVQAAGAHTLRYRATDTAGNTSAEQTTTFTVVVDGSDACPGSDSRDTVIIDGDDTGVANADTGNGCTINDLIDEHADYPGHAAFVRHVETVTAALVSGGTLTKRQQGAIVRAAARSDVGA
ncbi:plastocyanin/azurin family copper-binding protein [Micromonospora sp. WMMD812]|uniref:cupredoxin domain-containing protein n=1 Tax=Micromonospora sp. WMMD812 TaxID=3015152 RepID=UPI00248C1EBE|nr:plastocyanin/azurin family copper-binding protein [Micromonospora sp. WMMD812]WBB67856.1 plastocyanin/azurin family copper-binding protein [Micromonospora sp. WMMD812]